VPARENLTPTGKRVTRKGTVWPPEASLGREGTVENTENSHSPAKSRTLASLARTEGRGVLAESGLAERGGELEEKRRSVSRGSLVARGGK